jgi:peptidoglycan hydrolase CwlO-like protein
MTEQDYKKISVIFIVVILVGVLSCFGILAQINKDKLSTTLANQADIKTNIQNLQNITDSIEAELTVFKNTVETNLKQIRSEDQSIMIDFQALDSVVDELNASVKTLDQNVSLFK